MTIDISVPSELRLPATMICGNFSGEIVVSYEVRESFYPGLYWKWPVLIFNKPTVDGAVTYELSVQYLLTWPQSLQMAVVEMKALGF